MGEQLLTENALREAAPQHDRDRYASQVLEHYFVRGKLKRLPSQLRKREVVLRHLANQFEPERWYVEKRVNEILRTFNTNYDLLRRELVRMKMLARTGGKYRREG
jgi:hypothetical protein